METNDNFVIDIEENKTKAFDALDNIYIQVVKNFDFNIKGVESKDIGMILRRSYCMMTLNEGVKDRMDRIFSVFSKFLDNNRDDITKNKKD